LRPTIFTGQAEEIQAIERFLDAAEAGNARTLIIDMRVHRGGGLAKDAIYLRGLLEILKHLESGGALDPFWMGKIAAPHFAVMQELNARGLLKAPLLIPEFLSIKGAEERLAKARSGLAPIDLIAS
jgi:hypothetical protein